MQFPGFQWNKHLRRSIVTEYDSILIFCFQRNNFSHEKQKIQSLTLGKISLNFEVMTSERKENLCFLFPINYLKVKKLFYLPA